VAFVPPTRRVYRQPARMTIGLQVFRPPRPPADGLICGSCSSGRDFAYSFLQTPPRDGRPCCSARSSGHHGLQGTPTPKPLPGSVSLPGCNRHGTPAMPLRAMPGAPRKRARSAAPQTPRWFDKSFGQRLRRTPRRISRGACQRLVVLNESRVAGRGPLVPRNLFSTGIRAFAGVRAGSGVPSLQSIGW